MRKGRESLKERGFPHHAGGFLSLGAQVVVLGEGFEGRARGNQGRIGGETV
jgi:hypothetical protein